MESIHTVFSFTRITLNHLAASFEAREGHVGNRILLVVSFLRRDDRCKRGEREMNTREAGGHMSSFTYS
jgi:hypothetical protein